MPRALRNAVQAQDETLNRDQIAPITFTSIALIICPALFGDILPNDIRNVMLAVGCCFAVAYFLKHVEFDLFRIGIGFGWLFFTLFAVVNRWLTGGALSFAQIALPLGALAICASACSTRWIKAAMICIIMMLSVHLVATLMFYFIPDTYFPVKAMFFPDNRNAIGYQSGLTAHYSNNGLFMAAGFLLSISFALGKMGAKRKRWVALSLLFLFALVLTQKRAHLLFAIFALACTYSLSNFKGKVLKVSIAIIIACIISAVAIVYIPGVSASFERLVGLFGSEDIAETTSGRTFLWATAIADWQQSPIIGNGWGSFVYVWPGGNLSIYAHNELLQLLNDVGIIGLAFFIIIAGASLGTAYSNMKLLCLCEGEDNSTLVTASYFSFMFEIFMLSYSCTTGSLLQAPIDFIPYFLAVAISVSISANITKVLNNA